MRRQRPPLSGKLRTREHIIADLAINHAEKQVLLGNGTVELIVHDYGLDLVVFTFSSSGELEPGLIYLQVKATKRLNWLRKKTKATFRLERKDLVGWLSQLLPVILVVYDATQDRVYWCHIQGYFAAVPGFNLFTAGKTVTVHLSAEQVLLPATVRTFATIRDTAVS